MLGLKNEKNHWPNMVKIEWFKLKFKRMKWGDYCIFDVLQFVTLC